MARITSCSCLFSLSAILATKASYCPRNEAMASSNEAISASNELIHRRTLHSRCFSSSRILNNEVSFCLQVSKSLIKRRLLRLELRL